MSYDDNNEDKKARKEKIGCILSNQDNNNLLLSNLKDRLGRVEKELQLVNGIDCIQNSLKALDDYIQQVLVKINLNQDSISDLSKYLQFRDSF